MSTIAEKKNLTADLETSFLQSGNGQNADRKKVFAAFLEKGFPNNKTEEYKFTPITRALEKAFEQGGDVTGSEKSSEATLIPQFTSNTIVFVNGVFSKEKSTILDHELKVGQAQLDIPLESDPFALLNHAFHTETITLTVGDKTQLQHPISIVYLFDSTQFVFTNPRWNFKLGSQSEATILEYTIGKDQSYFTNKHTHIEVGENASLEYVVIQNESTSGIQVNNSTVQAASSSRLSCFTCTLNGQLVRNNLTILMDGQGIDAHLYGLYMIAGNTLTDNHTVVDHRKPNSYSNELYKGVMSGNSKGVFNGKIYVRPDAQKTNAFQSNRNILLSESATVNTKPQLEIWADDVKCSHGCTTGQLDEEALFYLRSRGISKEMARGLLLYAFASETMMTIKNEVIRKFLDQLITENSTEGFDMDSVTAIHQALDLQTLRKQFPILHQKVNGKDLVYFDNAATTQKPEAVIQALTHYYSSFNANIHRGIHTLAEKATKAFEETRDEAQKFLGAKHREEIIFVRGVTEAINLVASSYGRAFLTVGDEVIVSGLEHHSNIVPWQLICEEKKAKLRVIPVTESGELDMESFGKLLSNKTKIVGVNHASNSLGTINPIQEIIQKAHAAGAVVLIDGAQAAAHLDIDVQRLDCDFYCISGHKMYGPTGVGVLYGKKELLEKMPPYMGGGEMISNVTFEKTTWNDLPYKFEAGTPNIADVVAYKEAFNFIQSIGKSNMSVHEGQLLQYTSKELSKLKGVRLIGTAREKVSVQSFIVEGIHPFDIGQMLDARGIAVRTGHHCTQPLMDRFHIEGTVRASFAVYNTKEEINQLIEGVDRIIHFLK